MVKKIFEDPAKTAEALAGDLAGLIAESPKPVSIALSGGSTPELLFSVLADRYRESLCWNDIRFFWVDERCVPPDHELSNYGMTERTLLNRIPLPRENAFRIRGEDDPSGEAGRYGEVVSREIGRRDGLPRFDIVLLGMGDDGHTASIFPDSLHLLSSERLYDTAVHPDTRRRRITMTGPLINNARHVFFLICGAGKKEMVRAVLNREAAYPASYINPPEGRLLFYLDRAAAGTAGES